MKIQCTKEKIQRAVQKAERITGKNATLPVLACLYIEAKDKKLNIRATNLDIGVEITIPVKVEREGVVAVPGQLFTSFIGSIAGDETITLELDGKNLHVHSERNETTIKALSEEDFPTIPQVSGEKNCIISSEALINGMKSVWYSASISSMKPELSSVYLYPDGSHLFFVATDGFRLAEKRVEVKNNDTFESVLVPYRNVAEIIKLLDGNISDVEVRFDEGQIAFVYDGVYIVSRIVDGSFPDYKQIIPKEDTTEVIVLKEEFLQALKLSNIFSDKFNQITMAISPDNGIFEITSKNLDKGENKNIVDATLRGDDVQISFNHKYISDCFTSMHSDSLTLYFNGNTKPLVVRGVGDNSFRYLVMPLNK
jgi:DNA polymerase-3 subunit beta